MLPPLADLEAMKTELEEKRDNKQLELDNIDTELIAITNLIDLNSG